MSKLDRAAEAAYDAYCSAGAPHVQGVGQFSAIPRRVKNIARAQALVVAEALGPMTREDIEALRAEARDLTK